MGGKTVGPTAQERELERVSVAQWNDYVSRFQPAEAALAKRAELTQGEINRAQGEANADAAGAFAGLNQQTVAAGEISGAGVDSGRTKAGLFKNTQARGTASGIAQAAARTGAEIDEKGQLTGIARLGRGIAAGTTADLARGAKRAQSVSLNAAAARQAENAAYWDAAMGVAGAATRKFGPDFMAKRRNKKLAAGLPDPRALPLPNELDTAFPDRYNPFSNLFTDV